MSLTIKDCLKLPSLSLASVIAGQSGLNNIVNTVSVIEFNSDGEIIYTPNELLITAFYAIRDNVAAQCAAIETYKKSGDVGMVLFYTDLIVKDVNPKVIEVANRLEFPIIALSAKNEGIRYSDVIGDVMEAVFIDRKNNDFFVNNTMERISQIPEANRNITTVLSFASEYTKSSFFLCDHKNNVIAKSYWPFTNKIEFDFILTAMKNNSEYDVYKMPFTNKNGTKLILYAVGKNRKLNTGIMNEVIEVIQLFAVIWNYNLNISTRESLIPALLEDDINLAEAIAVDQKIDINSLNAVMFVDIGINKTARTTKEQVVLKIRSLFAQNKANGIVDLFGNLIVIISNYSKDDARDEILLNDLLQYFDNMKQPTYYGMFTNMDVKHFAKSIYLKYCSSIDVAKKIYPNKHFFNQSEINLAGNCRIVIESANENMEHYLKMLGPIIEDPEEDLLLTLSTYLIDADSESKKTSEILFVHRNTIQYRLSKIKNLINMDFSKMPMQYEIYFAVAILRVINS